MVKARFVNLGRRAWPFGGCGQGADSGHRPTCCSTGLLNNDVLMYCSPFSCSHSLVALYVPLAMLPSFCSHSLVLLYLFYHSRVSTSLYVQLSAFHFSCFLALCTYAFVCACISRMHTYVRMRSNNTNPQRRHAFSGGKRSLSKWLY